MTNDPREEAIFLDALVTYANSCTLPTLTPSCPFYVGTPSGPTCGEECRSVIEARGGGSDRIAAHPVDGLVMVGREIPIDSVGGANSFDAVQQFVEDREKAPPAQRTASLLISLRAAVTRNLLATPAGPHGALELWGELARRGVDIDRVFIGGLTRSIASSVALRTILDRMIHGGIAPTRANPGLADSPWTKLLTDAFSKFGSDLGRGISDLDASHATVERLLYAMRRSDDAENFIQSHPEVDFALSAEFVGRVAEWLTHQVADDLEAALRADPPAVDIFLALEAAPRSRTDEFGLWIWERFTLTSLDAWSQSSLLLEWKSEDAASEQVCPRRVLLERNVEKRDVGDRALRRASGQRGRTYSRPGLRADMLVDAATRLLWDGKWSEATKIFAALVDLQPGNWEAWNNYGFCQLAGDPAAALGLLQRAGLLSGAPRTINIANQVLALHILGRQDEAVRLAEASITVVSSDDPAYVWVHPTPLGELELGEAQSPIEYLQSLLDHLATACKPAANIP